MTKQWAAVATFVGALLLAHGALAFDSSKLSPGVVVQTNSFQSSKLSSGVVVQTNSFQSSKLSVGVVVVSIGLFESSKISAGVVVQSISGGGGGTVVRAPLTHW